MTERSREHPSYVTIPPKSFSNLHDENNYLRNYCKFLNNSVVSYTREEEVRNEEEKSKRETELVQQKIKELKDRIKELEDKGKEGYIYLLQEREFIRNKEDTYKIGHTTQKLLTRMSQYPKGSRIIYSSIVPNSKKSEINLLKLFNEEFTQNPEYGTEYFNGDPYEMARIISNELFKF